MYEDIKNRNNLGGGSEGSAEGLSEWLQFAGQRAQTLPQESAGGNNVQVWMSHSDHHTSWIEHNLVY